MRSFQKDKSFKNIVQSWPSLIILGALLLFFAWGVIRFTIKLEETSKNKKIAESKVSELSQNKEKLLGDIQELKTEKGLEKNIREKFGLGKVGEGLIVIVDDKNALPKDVETQQNWFMAFFSKWFK